MKILCFTVDIDRDVNFPVAGEIPAGSLDRGSGTAPRFASSLEGLAALLDLLDDLDMKATFFAEGRTLENAGRMDFNGHEVGIHGYDHEDLTGSNGAVYGTGQVAEILRKAISVAEEAVGRKPVCFRAPYMKIDSRIIDMLPDLGILYDSSFYTEMKSDLRPYGLGNGVTEVPVPEGRDGNGKKISAYMWPMHEGKRSPQDYLDLASRADSGIFNIATHTWHMVESRDSGRMSPARAAENLNNTRKVLEGLSDMGFKACTVPEAVRLAEHAH